MSSYIRDPVGTGVAVLIGIVFGVTLAAPMLPTHLSLGLEVGGDRITALLVLGTLGLVAVPVGVFLLYLLISRME
ncbi:hypothetical protein [Natronomonas amylolytica]|uniref:hypothetical protein n=1 Tax=Natronomonas amylolytica TaxID=3108498 RepID=UPI00300A4272